MLYKANPLNYIFVNITIESRERSKHLSLVKKCLGVGALI